MECNQQVGIELVNQVFFSRDWTSVSNQKMRKLVGTIKRTCINLTSVERERERRDCLMVGFWEKDLEDVRRRPVVGPSGREDVPTALICNSNIITVFLSYAFRLRRHPFLSQNRPWQPADSAGIFFYFYTIFIWPKREEEILTGACDLTRRASGASNRQWKEICTHSTSRQRRLKDVSYQTASFELGY